MKRVASAAVAVLLAFLVGCSKDNPVKPVQPGPKYPPSSTPFNTLGNLRLAYVTRDTTGYDSLFDPAYIGTSINHSDPSPTLVTFTRVDEAAHIAALARTSTITGIHFIFPPTLTREIDTADTLGWVTVNMYPFQIEIDDGPTSFLAGPLDQMSFKLRPTSPSPGSPTDTTWHIVRWIEVAP